MAYFSYAPEFGVVPSLVLEDTNENWLRLLSNPLVGPKEGSCVRGAVFVENASGPTKLSVEYLYGALFDLDGGVVPTIQQISQALEGHRFIVWTTYNSRPDAPRLRLFVPFASAVWPSEFRFVWHSINRMLGGIAPVQDNVDRLGYFPRIDPSREAEARAAYGFYIHEGPRLEPRTRFGDGERFPQEQVVDLQFTDYDVADQVPEPDRSDWYDDVTAKQKARFYFQNVGPGIMPGNRHAELLKIGCKLWWDFWLDREAVAELLSEINRRFPEPKPASEVQREVEAAYSRTRGAHAVVQKNPDGSPKEPGCMRKRPPQLTARELKVVAKRESKATDTKRREIGEWLMNIIPSASGATKPIADVNERDVAIRRCARFVGHEYPEHDPEALARIFADTITTSSSRDPWQMTWQQVQVMIEAAQRERRREQEEARERQAHALAATIRRATAGERDTPYTEAEIQAFADNANISRGDWNSRWVIALGSSHYVWVNGRYKYPVETANFPLAAEVDLSLVPNVSLHKRDREGNTQLKTRQEILSRYGTVAREGVMDMTAQQSYYDARTQMFVEAPCPLRTDIQPERVQVVEDWLATFKDQRVVIWIAYATILSEPLPALYLCGQRSSGKTLFGHAANRLWRKDRSLTDLEALFHNFNEGISGSPLLVADEVLPAPLLRKSGSEKFRQMVVSQSRLVNRKFLKSLSMTGYFRFLLLANNSRMLPQGSGFMNEHDSAAVSERILFVDLDDGPAAFLAGLSRDDRDALIEKDLFAKHALWLRDTRQSRGSLRLAVSGTSSEVTRRLDYGGVRGKVLHWVYNAVTGEGPFGDLEFDTPVFRNNVDNTIHVGVNINYMRSKWTDVIGLAENSRVPSLENIHDVVNTVRLSKSQRYRDNNGKQKRCHVINTQHVIDWAEWVGLTTEHFVEGLVERAQKIVNEGRTLPEFEHYAAPQLQVIEGGAS